MDIFEKNVALMQKQLKWFDTHLISAYKKMIDDSFVNKIIGLIQGAIFLYIYMAYCWFNLMWPGLVCAVVFDLDGKSSHIYKVILAIILISALVYLYKKHYIPIKENFFAHYQLTKEDSDLLNKTKIFFAANGFVGLLSCLNNDFSSTLAGIIMLVDFILFLYIARVIKEFIFMCAILALNMLFITIGAQPLVGITGLGLVIFILWMIIKNYKKILYIMLYHKVFFQWCMICIPIIYGIGFCLVNKQFFGYSIIGSVLIFSTYFFMEILMLNSIKEGIHVKNFLEIFCGVPAAVITLCIALNSIYNKINNDDNVWYNETVSNDIAYNESNPNIINDNSIISTNEEAFNNNLFVTDSSSVLDNYSGAVFGDGFETPNIEGLGAFSAGNMLNFGDTSVVTTIDIPEIQNNPYMLLTTNPTANNFHVTDANGMTQISVVDGKVYDATNTVIGGITNNPINGVTTLNTLTKAPIISMDSQHNIYAGTPETGNLLGHMDKGGAVDSFRDMSGKINFYTDQLGNTYGANGKPLGRISNI